MGHSTACGAKSPNRTSPSETTIPPTDVQRLLSHLANNAALLDRLRTEPDAVLSAYDLTPDEADRFRRGGPEALSLLSWAARGQTPPPSHAVASSAVSSPAVAPPSILLPVELLLQVTPTLQPDPEDADAPPQIAHMVALHPVGAEGLVGALFALHLAPLAVPQPDGSLSVRYTASIQPIGVDADPTAQPDTSVPTAPWGHDLDSPTVQLAAQAVREASPEDRYGALLALIQAMTGEEGR